MQEVSLPGGILPYQDVGAGAPIVFVHGILCNGRLWRNVVAPLSGRFRCLVPDWPLGSHRLPLEPDADNSPLAVARRIAHFLEALGLEDVTLVGNDTGGALCQLVAVNHPERVGRLVLTSCDALEVFPPRAFEPMLKLISTLR